MAFLNKEERDKLLDEIKDKSFAQIRGILNRRDKQARLRYYRNAQQVNKWSTRYILEGLGTQVTIVEAPMNIENTDMRRKYVIQEIIVEPTADNRL